MQAMRPVEWPKMSVAIVWGAMLSTGLGVWLGSGTPVAGAAIVIAVLLATASPTGAFYAVCASIPLVFHPITVGSLQLSLLELGILVTLAGSCFRFAFDATPGNRSIDSELFRPELSWALVAVVLAVGTGSLVWMPFDTHLAEALRTWRWVIVEPIIAFGLARLAIARNGRAWLVIALAIPGGFVALAALMQLANETSDFAVDAVHRSTATYLHPNNLALYLERILFLLLVPGILLKDRIRLPLLLAAGLVALGCGATFSRGAMLGVLAGGVVFLLAHPIRRGWSILGFGAAALVIGFGLVSSERLAGANSSGLMETRRYLWIDSLEIIRDFPWTGIGLDQFLWLHRQRYIDPRIWSERYTSHPHSIVLDAWLSLGVPGLIALLLFLIAGGRLMWSVRRGRRKLDPWQLGALAGLGAGLGHGLVDNAYFLSDLSVLTWICIAIVTSRSDVARADADRTSNG